MPSELEFREALGRSEALAKRQGRVNELRAECRKLLEAAQAAKRDLSTEEAERFDKARRELDDIHHREGGTYQTRREALEAEERLPNAIVGPQMYRTTEPTPSGWRTASGFETRALAPNESVRGLVEAQRPLDEELRGLRAGDVLRAMATGPRSDAEARALSMGSDSAGGYLVPSVLSAQVIDLMRARTVVMRAGARTLPLEGGEMTIAKVTADPEPTWRHEGTIVSESDVTFGGLKLSPRTLAMIVKVNRELLEVAPNVGPLLESTFAKKMAVKVDEAALIGAQVGDSWIVGVSGTDGIHTVAHNAAMSYVPVLQARTEMLSANSEEPTACILNPRDEGTLSRLTDGEDLPYPKPPAIATLPFMATTSIPIAVADSTSIALVGDFRRLLLCPRVQLRVELLKERYGDYLQVGYLVWLMMDIAVEEPDAFAKITGITASA